MLFPASLAYHILIFPFKFLSDIISNTVAIKDPKRFNCSTSSPKDSNGKVKNFAYWKLSELIDTATQTGLLNNDIKKFSHILRDFRNFIHPYEQLANSFSPDINTAKICCQVLKAAIVQLSKNKT